MNAVDLFAGAGGWTEGATQAGVRVVACVNHWPVAVATHEANHPTALHRCQDVALLDPRDLPAHEVLIASPACQGHARARGKERSHHDASRSTAWAVVDVAEVTRPTLILVENVPEFRSWKLYGAWRFALQCLGYRLAENVLDAADFGVPQHRIRLFLTARLGNKPAPKIRKPALDLVPANSFLDWAAGRWSPVAKHGRSLSTLKKVAASCHLGKRFLLPYYGATEHGRSADRPIGTITTRDRWALIDGDRMRMLSVEEARPAMGFRPDYLLTGSRDEQMMQLGNAVCPPVAREVVRQVLEAA